MAEGVASGEANKMLQALCGNATYTASAAVYIQLHTAAPGAAGTTNIASETTRKVATFAAASGGSIASNADVSWSAITGSQDATQFSAWTASTAGTFLFSGTITANPYTAGDTYTISSGNLTASLTVAS